MRPTFGREYIENEFQRIGDGLSGPLTVYLIGGGAMSLRDLKGATSCVENDDGCRLDIFNQQVANELVLTDGMQERSEPFPDTDRLTVRLVSNEDILLFKLIANRDDDIEHMNMVVQAGVDYHVVREELEAQIDRLGDDQFATFANEALVELEERYGVTTPIEAPVQELTDSYYRGLEVLQALDEPMTVDELAAELELDTDEVRDRIAYLSKFERVQRDVDTVRPMEESGRHHTVKEVGRLVRAHGPV